MRIYKNTYELAFGAWCGVFFNEETMKKMAKLQFETYEKLRSILENAKDVSVSNWSIAKEPITASQEERTFRYIDTAENIEHRIELMKKMFDIRIVKNLYTGNRKDAEKEHTEYLKELRKETNEK